MSTIVIESFLCGLTDPRVSNANQSPVPVGNKPIERHFHKPSASVKRLQRKYTIFCSGNVESAFASTPFGANGAKARGKIRLTMY